MRIGSPTTSLIIYILVTSSTVAASGVTKETVKAIHRACILQWSVKAPF